MGRGLLYWGHLIYFVVVENIWDSRFDKTSRRENGTIFAQSNTPMDLNYIQISAIAERLSC